MEVRPSLDFDENILIHLSSSAFQTVTPQQIPPYRRITQDEAPSMMPVPQNNSHQGNHGHVAIPFAGQPHSKPGSSASFASVSGGPYGGQGSGGNGHGSSRKKARLG